MFYFNLLCYDSIFSPKDKNFYIILEMTQLCTMKDEFSIFMKNISRLRDSTIWRLAPIDAISLKALKIKMVWAIQESEVCNLLKNNTGEKAYLKVTRYVVFSTDETCVSSHVRINPVITDAVDSFATFLVVNLNGSEAVAKLCSPSKAEIDLCPIQLNKSGTILFVSARKMKLLRPVATTNFFLPYYVTFQKSFMMFSSGIAIEATVFDCRSSTKSFVILWECGKCFLNATYRAFLYCPGFVRFSSLYVRSYSKYSRLLHFTLRLSWNSLWGFPETSTFRKSIW